MAVKAAVSNLCVRQCIWGSSGALVLANSGCRDYDIGAIASRRREGTKARRHEKRKKEEEEEGRGGYRTDRCLEGCWGAGRSAQPRRRGASSRSAGVSRRILL